MFKRKNTLKNTAAAGNEDQTGKHYEPEFSWESSRLQQMEKSEHRAWAAVKGLSCVTVGLCVAIAAMMPLKTVEPYVIKVDNTTGLTEILHLANTQDIPVSEMMHKYWISQYVSARETYDWRTINQEYYKVRELSLPNVFEVYASQFGGKTGLDTQLMDNVRILTKLNSIVINSDNIATVRFAKIRINNQSGIEEGRNFWTATIGFEYFPDFNVTEERRLVNPFGFKVTSYRVDPDISELN